MRLKWGLIGAGVAPAALGPIGLYVVLTYAYRGEPPWLGPLFYASVGALVLGVGLLVGGLIVRRRG